MAIGFSKSGLRRSEATQVAAIISPYNADRTSDLRNSMVPCASVEEYSAEIGKLWDHAKQSFLLIGRYLNQAKERLAHGEFLRLVERELPFGRGQAFQLRAVATMVDTGKVLEDELPSSPSIAYELSKLEPLELEEARKQGLLKANTTRAQIRDWRRGKSLSGLSEISEESRHRLKAALMKKIEKLELDLARARDELHHLDAHR